MANIYLEVHIMTTILKWALTFAISILLLVMMSPLPPLGMAAYGGVTLTMHLIINTAGKPGGEKLLTLPRNAVYSAMAIYMVGITILLAVSGMFFASFPYFITAMFIPMAIVDSFGLDN